MRAPHFILWLFLLATVSALLSACGGYSRGDASGAEVVIDETGSITAGTSCMTEDDCDGDGTFAECDPNDGDAEQFSLAEECDLDGDGYADTSCSSFDDGDGYLSDEERTTISVNCDVCPDMNDPTQDDTDQDGIGDLCAIAANVNISADPGDASAAPSVSDEAADGDDANSIVDADADADETTDTADDSDDDTDTSEPATDPDDPDADGLSDAIDPDPDNANAWGYINSATAETDECVPEKIFYDYDYIKGTATIVKSGVFNARIIGDLSPGLALSTSGVRVSGVTDSSKASLTTYACPGASSDEAFAYGIYIVSSGLTKVEAPSLGAWPPVWRDFSP